MEGAPHDLDPTRGDQARQAVEVVGMMPIEPFGQGAAGVQGQSDAGVAFEHLQKRQIAVAVRLLDHAVEIADGLMVVQDEDEADGGRHGWCSRRR